VAVVPVFGTAVQPTEAYLIWAFTCAGVIGIMMMNSRRLHKWFVSVLHLHKWPKLESIVGKVSSAFQEFSSQKIVLFKLFLFSLSVQIVRVIFLIFFALALGLEVNILAFFIFFPLIIVGLLLPVSIAGFGIREALFVFFFTRPEIGYSEVSAIALSLLVFFAAVVSSIPGLIIFMISGLSKKQDFEN
jgi:hypothetical protein